MLHRTVALSLGLAFLVIASPSFAGPNMQEGKWEITSKVEMEGMPMAMPATKYTQCITKKDMVPQKAEKNQDCKITDTKVSGDTVSWTMQCKSKEGTMDSNGKITYKKDTFDGTMHTTVNNPGSGKMQMTQRMSGRRIGDCK
jgi:hypothetical protein